MLTGENGILTKASNAQLETIKAKEMEEIRLAYNAVKIEKKTKTSKAIASKELRAEMIEIGENNTEELITAKELEDEMIRNGRSDEEIDVTGEGTLTIHFLDTDHIYLLEQNGEITEKEIGKTEISENAIIDMVGSNVALTASGKVIYIEDLQLNEYQLTELNIENYTTITQNGIREASNGVFVDNEGKVYTWGSNSYGQLGDGTSGERSTPVCISNSGELLGKNITNIYFDGTTVITLDKEGKAYTWGQNYNGELGDGTTENKNTPVCISELKNSKLYNKQISKVKILEITGGPYYCYIAEDGKVYIFFYKGDE